jgi:hypothetical protein
MNAMKMKKMAFFALATWALLVGRGSDAPAQAVPGTVSFTARLYDDGTPVQGEHTFVLRLFDDAAAGNKLWSELRPGIAVENGLVHLGLGELTPLDAAILSGGPVWLEVTVDGTTLAPRLPIRSVPYAVRAGTASLLGDRGPNDFAPADHAHTGTYMPAVTTSCGPGNYVAGLNANGTPQCASLNAAIGAYVNQNCFVYYGWRDSCDGCGNAPAKWGRVNGNVDCGTAGSDSGCVDANLGGAIVRLVGVNTDGDVNDDDKFYIGLKCF